MMSLPNVLVFPGVGAALGLLAHQALFIRGEWHVRAPEILVSHTILFASVSTARTFHQGDKYNDLLDGLSNLIFSYVAALLLSITIYRIKFHPLTKAGFSGPWHWRISKLFHVWKARRSKNHIVLEQYRQKYGDFVRTGPAEITVFDPQIYGILDGPRSVCIKSEWYDLLHPFLSLVSSRDKEIHAARRREWVRCFTSKALNEHENKILKHVAELDRQIEKQVRLQKTSEMRDLCFWFGFDTMGDFVFNKSFSMLTDNKWHSVIVRLQNALSLLGPFSPAPWLVQLGLRLGPSVWVLKDWHDSVSWAKGEMRARLDRGLAKQEKPDLTYYLMEQEAETSFKDSYYWMHGDSLLAIVAGSEPTAYVLLGVFCELARHPEHADKIYSELEGADISDMKTLNRLPHLNGVINETLRLYPVLLTGGARKTMSEGINVGDTYIPPNTTIVAPRYSIMRREDCFEKADTFIPERWTTRPEMIRNMAAFNPFSLGHHSCLGRLLAMDTMRYVISTIVKKYQFRLAPGETGSRVFDDMADQFTANPGKLALNFKMRKESS